MSSRIDVDPTSAVPAFEQIRGQVLDLVDSGALAMGDRLPTIRALAAELGVAPGTVARAYRELEQDGVIETRRRLGTVIADAGPAEHTQARRAARLFAAAAREAGLTDDEALAMAHSALTASR